MIITTYGAAEEVTGSKHLLDFNGRRVLLDCGMFQGHRLEADRKNREFPIDPQSLHAVVLSHAHIDHSGLLPLLGRLGFRGFIYCTPATRDLCGIMLMDSAHIQARDAEWLSKKERSFVPPLYTPEDVHEIMQRFVSVPYEARFPLFSDVFFTFHDAGHVLGSAMVELQYEEKGKIRRFIFSADIGRKNMPMLNNPWEPREADVVMMESTYGNREHDPIEAMDAHLARIVRETAEQGGKVLVPSFALERAQEIIYALKRLETAGQIPDVPVFVDSPLTVNVTEVFRLHTDSLNPEFRRLMLSNGDPFQLKRIRYIRSVEESMSLNDYRGPAVIISASGMCEHGRILHHLRNHGADARNTVLIVGFQAQHTLGRRIVEGDRRIKIFGVMRELNARVEIMNEFSAHAGRSELIEFATRFETQPSPVFLVHGETDALDALKAALDQRGVRGVKIQQEAQPVEV
jgi:metallo-beta-lactamase family protein